MKKNTNKRWLPKLLSLALAVSMLITAGPALGLVYRYEDGQRALSGHLKGDSGEKETAKDISLMGEFMFGDSVDGEGEFTLDNAPPGLKGALEQLDFNSLGLGLNAKVNVKFIEIGGEYFPQQLLDESGNVLVEYGYYTGGGQTELQYVSDRINRVTSNYITSEDLTSGQYTWTRSRVVDTSATYYSWPSNRAIQYKYGEETFSVPGDKVKGLLKDVLLTRADGTPILGEDIRSGWANKKGFFNFAEGSPLVPRVSNPIPFVTDSYNWSGATGDNYTFQDWDYQPHKPDPIKLKSFEYDENGEMIGEVTYAWSAGQQMEGYGAHGRYVSNAKRKVDGAWENTYYNDPSPTSFEPTFTGTIEKDAYGRLTMRVQSGSAPAGEGVDTSSYVGESLILTTRHSIGGDQPGEQESGWWNQRNRFDLQDLSTATDGGAAGFMNNDIDSMVGQQVTLQGHLLVDLPTIAGTGGESAHERIQGEIAHIFSVFPEDGTEDFNYLF